MAGYLQPAAVCFSNWPLLVYYNFSCDVHKFVLWARAARSKMLQTEDTQVVQGVSHDCIVDLEFLHIVLQHNIKISFTCNAS